MKKAVDLSKKIMKSLDVDYTSDLEDLNLHLTLGSIYNLPDTEIEDKNRVLCFVILAYSPDSGWLDLGKDRLQNKNKILESLGADTKVPLFQSILNGKNDLTGMCIFNYIEELKDWRWPAIFNLLEFSSKIQLFASKDTETAITWEEAGKEGEKIKLTEEIDVQKIATVNKQKGDLLSLSIKKREEAEHLLDQIRKDFVHTDNAVQSDFGFSFTDTSKKTDILSWRAFINARNEKKRSAITE